MAEVKIGAREAPAEPLIFDMPCFDMSRFPAAHPEVRPPVPGRCPCCSKMPMLLEDAPVIELYQGGIFGDGSRFALPFPPPSHPLSPRERDRVREMRKG